MAGKVDSLFVRLGLDLSDFNKGLQRVGKTLGDAGKGLTDIGKTLSLRVTAPILAMGAASLLAFGNFEKGMNRVLALTGAAEDEFRDLTELAKELGRTTQFSASQSAGAMGFLAQAGLEVGQIMSALPRTLELAAAAQLDLAEAADITTNIVAGLRLPVEDLARANDVLAKTASSSNVDVRQLGQSFKFVGPVATAAGLEFEEVTAILGLLGNAGIQASMAGTGLRKVITALQAPSGEAAKIIKDLGLQLRDGAGKMVPFVDILRQLEDVAATDTEILRIFGQRAGTAILALVGQSGDLAKFTEQLKDAGGTAQRIADIQMRGLTGAMIRMKSALEGAAIAIGERLAPLMTKIAGIITQVSAFVSRLDRGWLVLGVTLAGVAAVIGPLLLLLGAVATALSIIIPAMITAAPVIAAVAVSLSGLAASAVAAIAPLAALALPIAVSIAAMLAIGVAVVQVIKNWALFADAAASLGQFVRDVFKGMSDVAVGFAKDVLAVFRSVVGFFQPVIDAALGWANTLIGFFVEIAKKARDWLVNKFGAEINKMIRIANTAGFLFDKNFSPIAEIATGVALKASDAIEAMNKDFGAGFKDMEVNVKSSMDGITEAVAFGVNDIKKNLGEVATDARGIFGGASTAVAEFFGIATADAASSAQNVQRIMDEMLTAVTDRTATARENVGTNWEQMLEGLRVTLVDFQELVLSVWDSFTTGLGDAFAAAIVDSESLAASFKALAKTIAKSLISALVKLGIQYFVSARAAAGAASTQGAAVVGKNLEAVYSGAFAATAAIPIIGPSLAPGVAAAALATAGAGTTAAGAIGAAIGAKPFAAGGIVTRPTLGLLGEAGPEAVIPLSEFGRRGQTIIVELDGVEITRHVVEGMPDELRVSTGLEI